VTVEQIWPTVRRLSRRRVHIITLRARRIPYRSTPPSKDRPTPSPLRTHRSTTVTAHVCATSSLTGSRWRHWTRVRRCACVCLRFGGNNANVVIIIIIINAKWKLKNRKVLRTGAPTPISHRGSTFEYMHTVFTM
jgi:hypothetical protein